MVDSIDSSRRKTLKGLVGAGIAAPIAACSSSLNIPPLGLSDAQKTAFQFGVASGDPTSEQLIIWTRLTTTASEKATLQWQISSTLLGSGEPDFSDAKGGTVVTSAERDWCCKVDVGGLEPGTDYFYRFSYAGEQSAIGHGKTLPKRSDSVRLGLVSCSNYGFGFFNAYRHLAQQNLDAVYHAGDYLYEYHAGGYDAKNAAEMGRTVYPENELLSLSDYRARHAQYKSDPDLQAVHQAHSFICSWDDHETANDSYRDGAENHSLDEGNWEARKAAALQAYFEWMPVREPEAALSENYRSFQFADLVTLMVMETRLSGRDASPDYGRDIPYTDLPDGTRKHDIDGFFETVFYNPDRRMIGVDQEQWLVDAISESGDSDTVWQVLGNQTIMASIRVPDLNTHLTDEEKAAFPPQAQEFIGFSAYGLPYNLDAWDGYAAQRQRLFNVLSDRANNSVVLTGDTHDAWANNLPNEQREHNCAVEVATTSVTSPGAGEMLQLGDNKFSKLLQSRNPHIHYSATSHRGYTLLEFNRKEMTCEYYAVSGIESTDFTANVKKKLKVAATRGRGTAEFQSDSIS